VSKRRRRVRSCPTGCRVGGLSCRLTGLRPSHAAVKGDQKPRGADFPGAAPMRTPRLLFAGEGAGGVNFGGFPGLGGGYDRPARVGGGAQRGGVGANGGGGGGDRRGLGGAEGAGGRVGAGWAGENPRNPPGPGSTFLPARGGRGPSAGQTHGASVQAFEPGGDGVDRRDLFGHPFWRRKTGKRVIDAGRSVRPKTEANQRVEDGPAGGSTRAPSHGAP